MNRQRYWTIVVMFFPLAITRAEVVDSSAAGFTVRESVTVEATAERAYTSVVQDIGKWWDSSHTYSGKSENLSIDATAGGCFCEKLPGGGVRHMVVVLAIPGKFLRLSGALGPLQALAVTGSMTWTFTTDAEKTKLEVSYAVGGYSPGGLQKIAPAVDRVLAEQLERYVRFVETGKPK